MIIKYIIGILAGWVIGSIGIVVLTTLRVGLPLCYILLKNKEEDERALKELRKTYFISLSIWIPIIILITFLCYNFLDRGFYGYIIAIILMLILGFSSTGNNENNLRDFHNSLHNQIRKLHFK